MDVSGKTTYSKFLLFDYSKCENIHDGTALAFTTEFKWGEIDMDISANVKLGVLVIQTYTKFNDGSNRHNYYTREFYGKA